VSVSECAIRWGGVVRSVAGLGAAFTAALSIGDTRIVAAVLPFAWAAFFWPIRRADVVVFAGASVFFLGMDFAVLSQGAFRFRDPDLLGVMPWYEPFLWGFYYLALKRSFGMGAARPARGIRLGVALLVTVAAFGGLGTGPRWLEAFPWVAMAVVLAFFHEPMDLRWGGGALVMGAAVELTGVTSGLWTYPVPGLFFGVPVWFVPMWTTCGVLGRRVLSLLVEWLSSGSGYDVSAPGAGHREVG
jgi:hypothetical protein